MRGRQTARGSIATFARLDGVLSGCVHLGVVDGVRQAGWDTVGEIVAFENMFLLCYVRGPEGLIVELAERLDGAPG